MVCLTPQHRATIAREHTLLHKVGCDSVLLISSVMHFWTSITKVQVYMCTDLSDVNQWLVHCGSCTLRKLSNVLDQQQQRACMHLARGHQNPNLPLAVLPAAVSPLYLQSLHDVMYMEFNPHSPTMVTWVFHTHKCFPWDHWQTELEESGWVGRV